jgi:hypothetical protein
VLVLVGCWNEEIAWRRGFCPAKPKIECSVFGIGLASKRLTWVLVETCRMGGKGC